MLLLKIILQRGNIVLETWCLIRIKKVINLLYISQLNQITTTYSRERISSIIYKERKDLRDRAKEEII
jgi:hypothetical protein